MKRKLNLAFLWHMHQPNYRVNDKHKAQLPWVRLHCIRAYYDMARMAFKYPDLKMVFNFVPSLLLQIQKLASVESLTDFENNNDLDIYCDYTLREPGDLSASDKKFIVDNFFQINEAIIRKYKRYSFLLDKKNTYSSTAHLEFSNEEIQDLQALFNLAWFGFSAFAEDTVLSELAEKGEKFNREDIEAIISKQLEISKQIIPLYKELQKLKICEISTTPFYHPIMPLLLNTENSLRSRPNAPVPSIENMAMDVKKHLELSKEYCAKVFDVESTGLWPSEGSVCPELIPIVSEMNFKWMATCNGVLRKSKDEHGNYIEESKTYGYHNVKHGSSAIPMVFRDRWLSDRFGFDYYKMGANQAVEEFISCIKGKDNKDSSIPNLIPIILDGENPWEYYENSGLDFLEILYSRLSSDPNIDVLSLGEYITQNEPLGEVHALHSGSWINADYKIWIGGECENSAWKCLEKTRSFLNKICSGEKPHASKESCKDEILHSMLSAEGSDWFWWYGDDFESSTKLIFDDLFRAHQANIFNKAKIEIPAYLEQPIVQKRSLDVVMAPKAFISPHIDGIESHFFEWVGAGRYNALIDSSAMAQSQKLIEKIFYGFDLSNIYLRIDFQNENVYEEGYEVLISFSGKREYKISFKLGGKSMYTLYRSDDWLSYTPVCESDKIEFGKCVELALPLEFTDFKKQEIVNMSFTIIQNEKQIARYPIKTKIELQIPSEEFEDMNWMA
ncbi:MAG: glycoside hydrolase family 57 protein [Pseudomonadota bacterium]